MQNKNQNGVVIPDGNGLEQPASTPLSQPPVASSELSEEPTQPQTLAPNPSEKKNPNPFVRIAKRADVILAVLLILGSVGLVLGNRGSDAEVDDSAASRFGTTEIPLTEFVTDQGANFGLQDVVINGALQLNNGLVIAPSDQPASATAGQMYYDQATNVLAYHNGTQFVPVGGGVSSLQGQTGAITLTAGTGIAINGTTISSTVTGGSGTVASPGGTAGTIAKFTGGQTIANSLLSESGATVTVGGALTVANSLTLGTALTVANGGTGAVNLAANGVLVGNGTSPITSVTAGGAGQCLLSTGGAPAFGACPGGGGGVSSIDSQTGIVDLANATGSGGVVTIDNASTSAKGIAQFNATNFSAASGNINTIQDINTGATPTFAGVNTNSITPSGTLTIGVSGQTLTLQGNGSTTLRATDSGNTTIIGFTTPTANTTINFPALSVGTYTLCTTSGNCSGSGGGVTTAGGSTNRLSKFTGAQTIGDSTISDDGTNVTTTVDMIIQGGDVTIGTTSQLGSLLVHDGNGQTTSFRAGDSSGNLTFIFPVNAGTANQCLKQSGAGNQLVWDTCDGGGGGSSASLQTAYNNGNIITTTSARDIDIVLANTATDSNLDIVVADDSTSFVSISRQDGAGTNNPAQLLLLDNLDANQAIAAGVKIQSANGLITTALDVSDDQIGDALNVGANNIVGTTGNIDFSNFDVVGSTGSITSAGNLAINGGNITSTGNLTLDSGGTVIIPDADTLQSNDLGSTGALTFTSGGAGNIILNSAGTIELQDATNVTGALATTSTITLGAVGTADTVTYLCRNAANQLATCQTTGAGTAFVQGGNTFGALATLGTNDANDLAIERNNVTQLTVGNGNVTFASNVDLLMQGASAFISNPQGQTASEAFGLNAVASGPNSVVIGNGATSHASGSSVAVGTSAFGGINGTAVGTSSTSQGNGTALGSGAYGDSGGVALGAGASTQGFDNSIALGRSATTTATNQLVIGAASPSHITQVVVGNGVTNGSPVGFTLQGTSGSGTDIAGASVAVAGGQGTGTGNGGSLNFQIAKPGTSGSSLNGLTTIMSVLGSTGTVAIANAATGTSSLDVETLTLTNQSSSGTQRGLVVTNADDAANAVTEAFVSLINAEGAGNTVTDGLVISGTAGAGLDTIVDAIDVSDDNITNAINIGGNAIAGTNFSVNTSGTVTTVTLGSADTATFLCRNAANQIANCNATGTGAAFVQDGNTFGALATLGTNDAFDLNIERGGTTQLTVGNGVVTLASNVDLTLQGTTAYFSNTHGQTNSESFGNLANTTGSQAVAFGASAVAGGDGTAVGRSANAGAEAVSIGQGTTAGTASIVVGNASNSGGFADSIVIGANATATAANQLILGGTTSAGTNITQAYLGAGVTSGGAPSAGVTLNATGGSGTDIAGASLTLAGGRGTGTGNGGNINFQIADPGTTGSSLNALATVLMLSGINGAATFQNTTDSVTGFRVVNAAGTNTALDVDTSNGRVGINTAAPTGDLSFGEGADRTINVLNRSTNAAGNSLTLQGSNAGTGGSPFDGGHINILAGNAAGTGDADGGDIVIESGDDTGNGEAGQVIIRSGTGGQGNFFSVRNSADQNLLIVDSNNGNLYLGGTCCTTNAYDLTFSDDDGGAFKAIGVEDSTTADGSDLRLQAAHTTFNGGTGGDLNLSAGNSTGASGTRTGGTINIEAGSGTTANGVINIGTATSANINIGRNTGGSTTLIDAGSGGVTLQANGSATGVIQIGTGGAGAANPDFLALAVKSTTGDPGGGAEGYMYYNTADNKFRCFQGSGFTDCIGAGGSTDLDGAYDNDSDKELTIDNATGLYFNIAAGAGHFNIQDEGTTIASFNNDGSIDLAPVSGADLFVTLQGNGRLDVNATTYENGLGAVDIVRSGNFTGVAAETANDLRTAPSLTLTEPGSGTFTYNGHNINMSGLAVTAAAGTSVINGLSVTGVSDADVGTSRGIFIDTITPTAATETGLQIAPGWDTALLFQAPAAFTQTTDVVGARFDYSTNYTGAINQDIVGYDWRSPALSLSGIGTNVFTGYGISTAGALATTASSNSVTWNGAAFTLPTLNSSNASGTLTANGVLLTIPNTPVTQSAGTATMNGIRIASGTSAPSGTLNGISLGQVAPGGATETGINIGQGWEKAISIAAAASFTQSEDMIGVNLDYNSTFTGAVGQDITGIRTRLPGSTSFASGTTLYKGLDINGTADPGAYTTSGTGAFAYWGLDLGLPAITQTAGTADALGVSISTNTITTGGTQTGLAIDSVGVAAGTLRAIDISNITPDAGTEIAIEIGSGWDNAFNVNGTLISLTELGILDNNIELGDLTTQGTATDEFCLTSETGGGALLAWQACGGGGTDLDGAYDADADKELLIDNTTGLIFDMTTTGSFLIQDSNATIATFAHDGLITFAPTSGQDIVMNLTGNGFLDINATSYVDTIGAVDIVRTGNFTGVDAEVATELRIAPSLTLTEPATGSFSWIGQTINLANISVTAGAGTSTIDAMRILVPSDADIGTLRGLYITGTVQTAATQTALQIDSGWDSAILANGRVGVGNITAPNSQMQITGAAVAAATPGVVGLTVTGGAAGNGDIVDGGHALVATGGAGGNGIVDGDGGGTGGGVNLTGGAGGSGQLTGFGGVGGIINITGGNGGSGATGGQGGSVNITAGDGLGTNAPGGDVIIEAGARSGSGVAGTITLRPGTNSTNALSILNTSAVPLFRVDTTNSRVYIGDPTGDTTGALLVLDTKTSAGDPTGVLGGMYYNSSRGKMRCFELDSGTTGFWRDCIESSRTNIRYRAEMADALRDGFFEFFVNGGTTGELAGEVNHPGIVQAGTSTSATGNAGLAANNQNDDWVLMGNGDTWRFESLVRIPTLSTSAQRFVVRSGFQDNFTGDSTDGCYFRYSDNLNAGEWEGVCADAGSTTCDTNVAPTAAAWDRLTVVVNSTGTSVDFQVDGTSRCQVTTNIPDTAGNGTNIISTITKTVGTTARSLDHDYLEVTVDMTPR